MSTYMSRTVVCKPDEHGKDKITIIWYEWPTVLQRQEQLLLTNKILKVKRNMGLKYIPGRQGITLGNSRCLRKERFQRILLLSKKQNKCWLWRERTGLKVFKQSAPFDFHPYRGKGKFWSPTSRMSKKTSLQKYYQDTLWKEGCESSLPPPPKHLVNFFLNYSFLLYNNLFCCFVALLITYGEVRSQSKWSSRQTSPMKCKIHKCLHQAQGQTTWR